MSRLERNATWRAAGIALDLIRLSITMPIVARALGAEDYGRWSVAGSAIAMFMGCVITGCNEALVRECAVTPGAERALLRAGTRLRLALLVASLPLIAAASYLAAGPVAALAATIMAGGLFAEAAASRAVLLTVHLEEHRRLPARAVLTVVGVAATAAVAALGGGLLAFAALSAAQVAAAALVATRVALPLARPTPDTVPPRGSLARGAWPTALVCCLEVVHLQADLLIVGALLGPGDAGVLGAGVRIAYLPLLLLGAVTASAMPAFARLGPDGARPRALRLCLHTGAAGLAVPVLLALAAPAVVALFGPDYAALRWLLPALGLRVAIAAASGPLGTYALATGRQRANLVLSLAVVVVELGALAWVAPRWGLPGTVAVVVGLELPKALGLYLLLAERGPAPTPARAGLDSTETTLCT